MQSTSEEHPFVQNSGIDYRRPEKFKSANLRHAAWNSFRISRIGLIPIWRLKTDASGLPNEETKTFLRNCGTQQSCKEPMMMGEGNSLQDRSAAKTRTYSGKLTFAAKSFS
jgi:hypothetical protein